MTNDLLRDWYVNDCQMKPTVDDIEALLAEQKRLILEAGDRIKCVPGITLNERGKAYNQALTDYQDRIKKI